MKVLITTGIYPPAIGGPAQYAKELAESFRRAGILVTVKTYYWEHCLPSGCRHLFYFLKIIFPVLVSDLVIALDTFSVGMPAALAARLFGKKIIIRTGGDFLWEQYVERTREKIFFRHFYGATREQWSQKERLIFVLTKMTLKLASMVVFSTEWQRQIFLVAYDIQPDKTAVIENYYGPKEPSIEPSVKVFLGATRPLEWKNLDTLAHAFIEAKSKNGAITLDLATGPHEEFMDRMRRAYAIILVSLGDISPNMILDAIRLGKPFILTRETGLYEKLRGVGIFVDPLNLKEIRDKILELANPLEYARWRSRVEQFTYTHTWDEIRDEFLTLAKRA